MTRRQPYAGSQRPPAVISVFELFTIGIGPSSSHTVGPMRAAHRFVEVLADGKLLTATARIHIELYGSLGATARGHGTFGASCGRFGT